MSFSVRGRLIAHRAWFSVSLWSTHSLEALMSRFMFIVLAVVLFPFAAFANAGGEGPDVVGSVLQFLLVTGGCLLFHWLASRWGLPSILGWIVAGVVIGNLPIDLADSVKGSEFLTLVGELGIIFLMFKAGLEARPKSIKDNLAGAGLVALLGVIFVGFLGYGVAIAMLPSGSHWLAYVYVAAALTPTSAGIGAAIFAAKGKASSNAGILVLVAAVLDDVLGLVVMALLGALAKTVISGQPLEAGPLMIEAAKGLGFVSVGFFLGVWVLPKHLPGVLRLRPEFVLPAAVVACLTIAFIGSKFFGLAPLIGAYVAGLIFEQVRYREDGHTAELEHAVEPLVAILAPVFFFLIGTKVPVDAFSNSTVLLLALALTAATLVGKIFSGIGVIGEAHKPTVISGMMPRGEVAGIMVQTGAAITIAGAPLISTEVFTAFVLMIAMTTLLSIIGLNRWLK